MAVDDYLAAAQHIQGVELDEACGMVPLQASETVDGKKFYFRFRWGYASLSVAENPEADPVADRLFHPAVVQHSVQRGDAFDGALSPEDFAVTLQILVDRFRGTGRALVVDERILKWLLGDGDEIQHMAARMEARRLLGELEGQ